ncbi:DUF3560 domain-containing protein [Pseudomonas sp. NPDC098747]|uniref:DUF3560 domain-containing protein n=1 Tax=Pseudomonas sp. NPDC098747 TaxID=3364487 RepID=UPI00383BF606
MKKVKTTTVFHLSQTEALDSEPTTDTAEGCQAASLPIESAPASVVETVETAAPRPLNAYELKQQARRERYEDRATDAQAASAATYSRARDMASVIPFGQSILVGHHSERRDRNYRGKIDTTFGKAKHYAQKAKTVGTGGISSDDPDALVKLRAELAEREADQERMKAANKAIRAGKTPEKQIPALVALGFGEATARSLLKGDFCGRVGFAAYSLSNNNANMTRIKKRIQELEARRNWEAVEVQTEGYTYREDVEENPIETMEATIWH